MSKKPSQKNVDFALKMLEARKKKKIAREMQANTSTEPTLTEPTPTDPTLTEPTTTEPTITEPTITEPTTTEPTITEPTITEPTTTEPTITEPTSAEPTITEKPKRLRRTKAQIEAERSLAGTATTSEPITDDDFDTLKSDMQKASVAQTTSGQANINNPIKKNKTQPADYALITGFMLLYVIDTVFPFLIQITLKQFKGINLPAQNIKLSSEQMSQLTPLADQVARSLMINIKPEYALLIMLGLSYFENSLSYITKHNLKDERIKKQSLKQAA